MVSRLRNMAQKKVIYAVSNPFWLSDTFIFSYIEEMKKYVYIKINYNNKIEEIDIDIEKRMHNTPVSEIKNKKEATKLQREIFNRIGNEYWWKMYNHSTLK